MSDIDVDLSGLEEIKDQLEKAKENVEDPNTWFVGTNVEYSIYLEFGTSKMDPKPFFRPALNELRAKGSDGVIRENTEVEPESIEDINTYIRTLAFAMERLIKQIITQKQLVDTGTLRASILAVPNTDILPDADEFGDENVSPDAGRRFVEDIEVKT